MHNTVKLLSLLFVVGATNSQIQFDLMKVREWRQLDFNFPNPRARDDAIRRRLFVPQNNFPIDVDVDYNGEEFD
jgi:hypothetical protein